MKAATHIERRQPVAVPEGFPADLHPLLAQVLASRHINTASELQLSLEALLPPDSLLGLEAAVTLLVEALQQRQRILIVGDFDADGATSTAVAVRALRAMGAAAVDFLVPNRFEYGYGLTPEIVAEALQRRPDLIVTVDNGISSLRGVAAAREAGVRVLVTDHHLPAAELPAAHAIVNPNQQGDPFPAKGTAGVGVIFYVMLALRTRLRETGWFAARGLAEPNLAQLLDLVALGTVADVVPLEQNNRILVAQGLRRIRCGQGCPGVQALIAVAGRNAARLVASDLGFAVGPRLNAAGRLDDMSVGIRCLLTDSEPEARAIAAELDALNRERREIEEGMRNEALEELQRLHLEGEGELPRGLCLYNPDWHQGVIGILASRIKERLHRPVIVFADGEEGIIKGSARSIPGLHIRDALDAVAAHHPGLISKFGGHAMAAGLSLEREHYPQFKSAFEEEVERQIGGEALRGILLSDGELPAEMFDLELARLLRDFMPWGQAFPEPLFDGFFSIVDRRIVAGKHLKLQLLPLDGGAVVDAIAFNIDLESGILEAPWTHLAYRLDVNEWRGNESLQLLVSHLEPLFDEPCGQGEG